MKVLKENLHFLVTIFIVEVFEFDFENQILKIKNEELPEMHFFIEFFIKLSQIIIIKKESEKTEYFIPNIKLSLWCLINII